VVDSGWEDLSGAAAAAAAAAAAGKGRRRGREEASTVIWLRRDGGKEGAFALLEVRRKEGRREGGREGG